MVTWAWSYNGATWGEGTDFDVVEVEGLGAPDMRTSDVPRLANHGVHPGRDLLDARTVTLDLELLADDDADLAAQLAALATATAPRDDELPLTFQLPGEPAKRLYARCRRRNLPVELRYLYQFPTVALQFVASDPLLYAEAESINGTAAPTPPVGFGFPLTFPVAFGAAGSGGTMAVTNTGTAPTRRWLAAMVGPCSEPRLIGPGGTVSYGGSLAAGELLILDGLARTVLLAGMSSRYSLLKAGSVWFELPPGTNEVKFSTADGQGAVFLSWRDAWW